MRRRRWAASACWVEESGSNVEVALVGREGAIGGVVSNGRLPAFATSQVRAAGRFLRIKTSALEAAKLNPSRFAIGSRATPIACWPRCSRQRPAMPPIRSASGRRSGCWRQWPARAVTEFQMTQDQLAEMLGVGRTFVTRVLRQLPRAGNHRDAPRCLQGERRQGAAGKILQLHYRDRGPFRYGLGMELIRSTKQTDLLHQDGAVLEDEEGAAVDQVFVAQRGGSR